MELLLLILLGIVTYFVVKRSVVRITRTPVWILWLVMMIPALTWSAWIFFVGEEQPIPVILAIGPFLLCPLLYWLLIQWGRKDQPASSQVKEEVSLQQRTNSQQTLKPQEDLSKLRPITKDEEATLRNCFPWGVYYLSQVDYRPQAILCRGKLRSNPEVAYKTIKENVEENFGDRFILVFQESIQNEPFFALVPNPQFQTEKRPNEKLTRPGLAIALLVITLLTTTFIGVEIAGNSLETVTVRPDNFKARIALQPSIDHYFGDFTN